MKTSQLAYGTIQTIAPVPIWPLKRYLGQSLKVGNEGIIACGT